MSFVRDSAPSQSLTRGGYLVALSHLINATGGFSVWLTDYIKSIDSADLSWLSMVTQSYSQNGDIIIHCV